MTTPADPVWNGWASALEAVVAARVDVTDVLAELMTECQEATGAAACALMAVDRRGELSLLAAESHRAVELEMLQIQRETGPCVDVIASGAPLRVAGAVALEQRWPDVATAMAVAGFTAVHSFPMRWRGTVLGALNLFFRDPNPRQRTGLAQAYADISSLVVVNSAAVDADQVKARMHEALVAREVIEQAKGVLAYQADVDMAGAYRLLQQRAEATSTPLTQAARDVLREATQPRSPGPGQG